MIGNYNQYDPTELFKEWIQKGGKAQTEFMKAFASTMNPCLNCHTFQFFPLS